MYSRNECDPLEWICEHAHNLRENNIDYLLLLFTQLLKINQRIYRIQCTKYEPYIHFILIEIFFVIVHQNAHVMMHEVFTQIERF